MTKLGLLAATTLCIAGALGCAKSREATPAPGPSVGVTQSSGPGEASQAITATATVEDVDQKNRLVTLRTADGERKTIKVGEEVRNLPQVKKGDIVTATYYESIALSLRETPGGKPSVSVSEGMERAPLGSMPAGAVVRTTTLTAKVIAVDKKKQTVSLEGPQGGQVTLKVQDPSRLEGVDKGDLVEAVYREAVVISVDKPTK
jgi:Cu/Ag efflux protein CusF